MTSSGKFVVVAETTFGGLTCMPRQSFGKPGSGSSRHSIHALREQSIDVIAALGVGEHVDATGHLVVAIKHRIDHIWKIAQLHR